MSAFLSRIRPFRVGDAPALADLFHASVREVGSRDYSPEQVRAWSPVPPNPARYVEHASDGRTLLVAVNREDQPIAYGDLETDGHIDHLYCRPDCVGRGVASALYDCLERAAIEQRIALLIVEASEAARGLFERKGFTVEERREFPMNGVLIHNYRMTKQL